MSSNRELKVAALASSSKLASPRNIRGPEDVALTAKSEAHVTVVRPTQGWVPLHLRELREYRELIYFLTWRDIKVRYKQTALGAAWAIIQPLFTMLIFSLFFGRLAKIGSDNLPYPIWSYAALVPWTFFANALTQASNSLVSSQNLITKVYFPRLTVPLATVTAGVVDFCLALVVGVVLMLYFQVYPGVAILWLPAFFLLAFITCLGVSFWLSALNVRFRDVRYVVPFLVQFWMFATPVAYPASYLKGVAHTLYGINPMAGVVEGFRWALLGSKAALGPMLWVSVAVALATFIGGAFYFRRVEKSFADLV